MNTMVKFSVCTLSDEELVKKVDKLTDEMFQKQEVPTRNIPAEPNNDYDLLVGELLIRFSNLQAVVKVLKPTCSNCKHLGKYTDCDICNNKDLRLWNLSNCDINIEEWGCTYFEERKA